jgi:uncharacterized membrane protein YjgN (DUF898 family)
MAANICTGCGFQRDGEVQGTYCPRCGTLFEAGPDLSGNKDWTALDPSLTPAAATDRSPKFHTLQFLGTAREYFRIWVVNTCLTIVTVGIYAAWAKVRTRQYFYINTRLTDHPFHFLGRPTAILKGNIILGAGFLIYLVARGIDPVHAGTIFSLFYLVLPYLVYKSLRFNTRYSAFRNVRFGFQGTAGESYLVYLLLPFLIPFTLAAIVPYWEFRRKKYLFDNLTFGTTRARFSGKPGYFYRTYIKIALIPVAVIFLLAMGAVFIIPVMGRFLPMHRAAPQWSFMVIPVIFSAVPLFIITIVQQALYVHVTNYCWGETRMGDLRFQSTLKVWPLIWIRLSNIVAVLFTAGLLIPWAKIRRFKYVADHFTVISEETLDVFSAASEPEVNALGDAATDFFDIGFGL